MKIADDQVGRESKAAKRGAPKINIVQCSNLS